MNPTQSFLSATLLLVASSSLSSAPHAQPAPDLAGKQLDGSATLVDLRPLSAEDRRDNLCLFGQRPTLVVVGTHVEWKKKEAKAYTKRIKKLDKFAAKWKRDGVDVLFIAPRARIFDGKGGEPLELELIAKSKPKNLICAHLGEELPEEVAGELLATVYTSELQFNWALLDGLGAISASGGDLLAKDNAKAMEKLRKSLSHSELGSSKQTKAVFEALNQWRLGEADDLLGELEAAEDGERSEVQAEMRTRLVEAAAYYRRTLCYPQEERGFLPEYVEQLEHFASHHLGESELASSVMAEVEATRSAPEFAGLSEQRAKYKAALAVYEDMDDAVERIYEESMGKNRAYDEAKYNSAIREVYPGAIEELRDHVKALEGSPYRREVAILLMEAKEDLQYAS